MDPTLKEHIRKLRDAADAAVTAAEASSIYREGSEMLDKAGYRVLANSWAARAALTEYR